eukprot:scaffold6116_cov104-Isochrysis_galbana.AAC.3
MKNPPPLFRWGRKRMHRSSSGADSDAGGGHIVLRYRHSPRAFAPPSARRAWATDWSSRAWSSRTSQRRRPGRRARPGSRCAPSSSCSAPPAEASSPATTASSSIGLREHVERQREPRRPVLSGARLEQRGGPNCELQLQRVKREAEPRPPMRPERRLLAKGAVARARHVAQHPIKGPHSGRTRFAGWAAKAREALPAVTDHQHIERRGGAEGQPAEAVGQHVGPRGTNVVGHHQPTMGRVVDGFDKLGCL